MGKCLSCCEDPDDANHVGNSKHGDVGSKPELSSIEALGCFLEASMRETTVSDRHLNNGNHGRPAGTTSSTGGTSSNTSGANNEKSMLCALLSVGSGEGKRVCQLNRDSCSEGKLTAFYEQYKDPTEDAILSEGIERLCQDLEVKPEEFKVLVLAWKFGAATMCRFTRQEFTSGCRAMKVASVRGIQSKFPELLQEVQDPEKFKDLYRFTFLFGLDSEAGQRLLPTDMATSLWKLVFSQREPALLKRWLSFLEKHPNVRGIPRDTWNMFLNFLEAVGDDLSAYDDAEAWPSLFDDFVEYENDQTNQNVQHKEPREESEIESREA